MSTSSDQANAAPRPRSRSRTWFLRGLSVAFGLSFFAVLEAGCAILGIGSEGISDDPFVGFSELQPLFELNPQTGYFETSPARLKFFPKQEFTSSKPTGTRRLFCLGGSTVQGRPFSTETSFTKWLELALNHADPESRWELINCGGISCASYRLAPILEECLNYEPDGFILCTGHNEFLEDRTYGTKKALPGAVTTPVHYLNRLRSFRVLRNVLLSGTHETASNADRFQLGSNIDAMLDYHNGLAAYHRDDVWRESVIQHFGINMNRMLITAASRSVPVVLVLPPSNLADTPPFKSEHRVDITKDERKQVETLIRTAHERMQGFPHEAVFALQNASRIDQQFARTRFELGVGLEETGQFEAARKEFVSARDQDICPLRMVSEMETIIRQAAERHHVPLLDAHDLLEQRTRNRILDNSQLVDHVHPSFDGHQQIALALVETLQRAGHVEAEPNWTANAKQAFETHFENLPDVYFAKGEQNLANLRYWTQGEADGPPVESRFPERVSTPDSDGARQAQP